MGLRRKLLDAVCGLIGYDRLLRYNDYRRHRSRNELNRKRAVIAPGVQLLGDVRLDRNVYIGEGTYINSAQIYAGPNSVVRIGQYCAIGNRVSIKARAHDLRKATPSPEGGHMPKEADIVIGDHVYLGDNVFVKEGVTIGEYAVVGANSVVTRDVAPYSVVGGCPAKLIKTLPADEQEPS